ncbi:MAG: HD-GYP domain-containing protein [Firmicutes bacterium]|nr:HD-GYP domain-containing protein [Bacillota bacterium]
MGEKAALKLYLTIIIAAGLALLVWLVPRALVQVPWLEVLFFVAFTMATEAMPVYLPREITVSVSFCVIYAALLIHGPGLASLAAAMGSLVGNRPGTPHHRIAFNFAQLALSAGAAGAVFLWAGGEVGHPNVLGHMLPILAGALSYFFVNSSLISIAAGLSQELSPLDIWISRIGGVVVNYLVLIPLGVLIAILFLRDGIVGVLLLVVPLALARFSFQQYVDMRNVYLDTIRAIAATVDAKDSYTRGHSERVRGHSVAIAKELGLPEGEQEIIEYMALLHDTGKIGISEAILNKNTSLTDEEYQLVQKHPIIGAQIVSEIDRFKEASAIVRHHHEHYDGSGYPDGLAGEEIPLGARIITVADAFDAMTSQRPYRGPRTNGEALAEIRANAGRQFDPLVVKAFLRVMAGEE